jgi:hypothetical protein
MLRPKSCFVVFLSPTRGREKAIKIIMGCGLTERGKGVIAICFTSEILQVKTEENASEFELGHPGSHLM